MTGIWKITEHQGYLKLWNKGNSQYTTKNKEGTQGETRNMLETKYERKIVDDRQ